MKITPIQSYFLFSFLLLGVILGGFYQFIIKPINVEIMQKTSLRDQKKKDLEEAKRIVQKYAEFKKRADSVQRELEWAQNRIPKVIEKTKLLEAISLVQKKSDINITNLVFSGTPIQSGLVTEIPVNVRFDAKYESLLKFLYEISVSNLMMTTRDLSVTAFKDKNNPNSTVSVQVTVCGIQSK